MNAGDELNQLRKDLSKEFDVSVNQVGDIRVHERVCTYCLSISIRHAWFIVVSM